MQTKNRIILAIIDAVLFITGYFFTVSSLSNKVRSPLENSILVWTGTAFMLIAIVLIVIAALHRMLPQKRSESI